MRNRIELALGLPALVAVVCSLAVAGTRPGSAWGALPGADEPAQAATAR